MLGRIADPPDARHAPRIVSARGAKTSRVLVLCALLLVGCGFIEGYISPDPDFPLVSRVIVGFGYGAVMVAALTGRCSGRRMEQPQQRTRKERLAAKST